MAQAGRPKSGITKKCVVCSTEFYLRPSRASREVCSKKCWYKVSGERQKGNKNPSWKNGKFLPCVVCKKDKWFSASRIKEGRKSCSNERRKIAISGENSHRWISDREKLVKFDRRIGQAYRDWRKAVLELDSWTCQLFSNTCSGRLETHHIFNWQDYKYLRYVVNNGITLCNFHHPLGRSAETKLITLFQSIVLPEGEM